MCVCPDTVHVIRVLKWIWNHVKWLKEDFWNKQLPLNLALSKPMMLDALKHAVAFVARGQTFQLFTLDNTRTYIQKDSNSLQSHLLGPSGHSAPLCNADEYLCAHKHPLDETLKWFIHYGEIQLRFCGSNYAFPVVNKGIVCYWLTSWPAKEQSQRGGEGRGKRGWWTPLLYVIIDQNGGNIFNTKHKYNWLDHEKNPLGRHFSTVSSVIYFKHAWLLL